MLVIMLPYDLIQIVCGVFVVALLLPGTLVRASVMEAHVKYAESNATLSLQEPMHFIAKRTPEFFARILPLGASIVFGLDSTHQNGFRKDLRNSLRLAGWNVNMVGSKNSGQMADNNVEAHSGDMIEAVHKALSSSIKYQPNIVIIHAGSNDCNFGFDTKNAGARMARLLDMLFAQIPGTTVILSTLIPSNQSKHPLLEETRPSVNSQFRELVKHYRDTLGKKIVLAEMAGTGATFLAPKTDLVSDGMHPNDGGYKKMAVIWFQAITAANEANLITAPNPTLEQDTNQDDPNLVLPKPAPAATAAKPTPTMPTTTITETPQSTSSIAKASSNTVHLKHTGASTIANTSKTVHVIKTISPSSSTVATPAALNTIPKTPSSTAEAVSLTSSMESTASTSIASGSGGGFILSSMASSQSSVAVYAKSEGSNLGFRGRSLGMTFIILSVVCVVAFWS